MASDALEELEGIVSLDPDTKTPPTSRMSSPVALRNRHSQLQYDDRERNKKRAKVQALIDGVAPYDQAVLNQLGQGSRTNVNRGDADRYINLAVAGFVDLEESVETLVNTPVPDIADQNERYFHESNIQQEISRSFRSWEGFHSNYLQLANVFVGHGVGFSVFPDSYDWRYKVKSFGNLFIPANTPASPDKIGMVTAWDDCSATDLYGYIRNEKAAANNGWNIAAVKEAIVKQANESRKDANQAYDWESIQRRLKNGDDDSAITDLTVRLIYGWVREFDGSISFFVTTEAAVTNDDAYLCQQISRYKHITEAINPIVYGVGSNGTYHSIRGLGQRIFAICQLLNRLSGQAVDGAMMASSLLVQPNSMDAMRKMQIQNLGGIMAVPPDVVFKEIKFSPRLGDTVLPAVDMMSNALSDSLDFYSAQGAAQGSPYRNRLQVEAELEQATRLTSASLSLFYAGWGPLLREMVKRFVNTPKHTDPIVADFYKRLAARGTTPDIVKMIDFDGITAVRAIGGGNAPKRVATLNRLQEKAALLPEDGRRNLTFDIVAAEVGYDNARRYASPADQPRPTTDAAIAVLENTALIDGKDLPVFTNQLHGEHLKYHLPEIQEIITGIEDGTIDPMAVLEGLTALHNHSFDHLQLLAADPFAQEEVAAAEEILQHAGMQILNFTRQAEKEAREIAEQGGDQAEDAKVQAEQLKLQHTQLKGEIDLRLANIKLETAKIDALANAQQQAAKTRQTDAQTAASILQKSLTTRTGQ